jgi:peptidoglycan hydrolase-like protein with peptidoglycan-binding domain
MKKFVVAAVIAASFVASAGSALAAMQAPDLEGVRQAQQELVASGFNPGPVNGMLNGETQDAIRQFQNAKGLPATGQLDAQTTDLLSAVSGITFPGVQ